MFMHGLHRAFVYGYLGLFAGVDYLPIAFLAYGCCSVLGHMLWGKLYDKFSWVLLIAGSAFGLTGFYIMFVAGVEIDNVYLLIASGCVYGFADTAAGALIPDTIMVDFPSDSAVMYALYNFIFCVGSAVGFGIVVIVPSYLHFAAIALGVTYTSIACYLLYQFWFNRAASMRVLRSLSFRHKARQLKPTSSEAVLPSKSAERSASGGVLVLNMDHVIAANTSSGTPSVSEPMTESPRIAVTGPAGSSVELAARLPRRGSAEELAALASAAQVYDQLYRDRSEQGGQ